MFVFFFLQVVRETGFIDLDYPWLQMDVASLPDTYPLNKVLDGHSAGRDHACNACVPRD